MEATGSIGKMKVKDEKVVQYYLPLGQQTLHMNDLIGTPIAMEYLGHIHCIRCGRETRKSFAQGYCYPCFISAPETEECVLRPELCRAHDGIARDMDYAREHCLTEQVVYLSVTSGIKVGVTRSSQVPIRWIDQGASSALEFARTPNRYLAGLMEVALKQHLSDKTNWRLMLSGSTPENVDLPKEKRRLMPLVPEDLSSYITENMQEVQLEYPVIQYPEKIKSLDFEKNPLIEGVLTGIKGQYLMLDQNKVINIRKYGGYQVHFASGI